MYVGHSTYGGHMILTALSDHCRTKWGHHLTVTPESGTRSQKTPEKSTNHSLSTEREHYANVG